MVTDRSGCPCRPIPQVCCQSGHCSSFPAVIEYVTASSFTSKADTVPTASPTGARALISNEYESALNLGGRGLHAAVVAVSVGDHRPALAL